MKRAQWNQRTGVAEGVAAMPVVRGGAASQAWAVLVSLALPMLLSSLGISIANVALPTIARDLSASFQSVQWIVLAYLLAMTTMVVSAGRLGDAIGRRRLLLGGVAVFTAASALCAVAPTLPLLIGARAMQGLGAAVMTTLTMALAGDAVPREKTGSLMGLLGTVSAIGTALGPSLGGILIATLGWRSVFFVNVPLGLAALLLAAHSLPAEAPPSSRTRFDFIGAVLLSLTLGAYAVAMTIGRGQFGLLNGALVVVAIASCVAFVLYERSAESPLVPLSMFREPGISAGFATSALITTVVMATLVVGPFYLSGALALDASSIGLIMSAGPMVAALAGVPAGRLVDRIGSRRTMIAGLLGSMSGAAMMALLPSTLGVTGYVVPLVVITAGYALFQAANNTSVLTGVRAGQRGVVSGMLSLSRNLGLITGASMMGAVFALASGAADAVTASAAAVTTGMRATFTVAATLIGIAIMIASRTRTDG